MYIAKGHPKISTAVAISLIVLLVKPVLAVTTTLPSSQTPEHTTNQRELPKRQQTRYLMLYPSETRSTEKTPTESPSGDLPAGSLIGRVEILAAARGIQGTSEKAETRKIEKDLPRLGGLFVEIYGGAAIPQNEKLKATSSAGPLTDKTSETVNYDDSFAVGGRVGYWSKIEPYLGAAVDASYYQPEADGIDLKVYSVTLLAMFRYPIGKFHPYLGIGGGLFITDGDIDIRLGGQPRTVSDISYDAGFDGRAGLAYQFHPNIAVFGEYRFTYYSAKFKDSFSGALDTDVKVKSDYNTHFLLVGVSYRF
ncbi:MAG: porin family protein [Syntrophobacterales bacterium]|jgi:opacity protein-like surface antigen